MSTKYYLQNNLIIRGDIGFSPEFVVYNIENGESYQIDTNIFLFLYLISNSNNSEVIKRLGYRNIERLKKLGFISSSYSNNKVIINPQTKFNVKTAYYPREVEIHLTSYCNLQCKHCVYDIKRDSKDYIRTDYLLPLVDEMEKMGVFKIILSGGEPLIHKDIMKILDKLKDKRLRVEILTNAISINTEMAIKLASKNFSITCSLDGYNAKSCDFIRGKGSFEKILKSIRNLNQAGARHNICCVINRLNFKTADKIIKLGEKLKTYSVNFLFLDPMGRAEKLPDDIALKKYEIIEFIKTIKKIPSKININFLNPLDVGKGKKSNIISCSAATYRCAINALGEIYPCVYGFGNTEFKGGELRKNDIKNIWFNKKWNLFRGGIKDKDLKTCRKCKYINKCQLKNCRLRPYFKYKDLYAPYPGCPMSKEYA